MGGGGYKLPGVCDTVLGSHGRKVRGSTSVSSCWWRPKCRSKIPGMKTIFSVVIKSLPKFYHYERFWNVKLWERQTSGLHFMFINYFHGQFLTVLDLSKSGFVFLLLFCSCNFDDQLATEQTNKQWAFSHVGWEMVISQLRSQGWLILPPHFILKHALFVN